MPKNYLIFKLFIAQLLAVIYINASDISVLNAFDIDESYIYNEEFVSYKLLHQKRLKRFYRRSLKRGKDVIPTIKGLLKEEEINKVIDNLRKMRAKDSLVDRPAKKGDKTEINFKVFLDNVPVDGGSGEKYPLVLGESTMIPGFEDQVVGMKKDEEKETRTRP